MQGAEGIQETSAPSTQSPVNLKLLEEVKSKDFPGGPVLQSPPANASQLESSPCSPQLEKRSHNSENLAQSEINKMNFKK